MDCFHGLIHGRLMAVLQQCYKLLSAIVPEKYLTQSSLFYTAVRDGIKIEKEGDNKCK